MRGFKTREIRGSSGALRALAALVAHALVMVAIVASMHRHGSLLLTEIAGPSDPTHRSGSAAHSDVCQTCRMAHDQLPAVAPPARLGPCDAPADEGGEWGPAPIASADRAPHRGRAPPLVLS